MSNITFKLNKDLIVSFLTLLSLKGDVENKEALVEGKAGSSLETGTITANQMIAIKVSMISALPTEVTKIGLSNVPLLRDYIKTLGEADVEFELKENKVVIRSEKERFSSVVLSPTYISNTISPEDFDKFRKKGEGNMFSLTSSQLAHLVKNFTTFKSDHLMLSSSEGKKVTATFWGIQTEMSIDFDVPEEVSPFKLQLSKLFVDLIDLIKDDIKISAKNNSPVYIFLKKDKLQAEFIVAPIVEETA